MPRRVFTYPAGPGLRRAEPRLEHRRLHPGGGLCRRRLGPRPPEGEAAVLGAQSVGRRHAGVAAGDARQAVGRPLDPGDRQPLSALGPAELRARRRRRPVLPARRRRGKARDAGHLASSTRSRSSACACRGRRFITLCRRPVHRRLLHLRHVSLVVAGRHQRSCWRSASSSYWLWTGTAFIPEKEEKDVGLGLTLPLYVSGRRRSAGGRCSSPCSPM